MALQLVTIKYRAHPFVVDDALHYAYKAPFFSLHSCRARTLGSQVPSQNALCKKHLRQVALRVSDLILPPRYALCAAIAIIPL